MPLAVKIQPVLVGAGQLIDRPEHLSEALSPLAMMHATSRASALDAGLSPARLKEIETLVVIDTVGPALLKNAPASLAACLGAQPSTQYLTVTGGNTPQMLINHFANEIACERTSMVLLSGAEALDTLARSAKTNHALNWQESPGDGGELGQPTLLTADRSGTNETEEAHGMVAPIVTYPLFENALRRHYGRSLKEHQLEIGKLLAPMTEIASRNPYAWFPTPRSAEEIATPTISNRYIGFPYTKYMNAVMQVNQSASVLLMSDLKAKSLGIDESRWIYLHGHCDVTDIWHVSERVNFHSSPALEVGIASALDMAQVSQQEIDHFDVYSCFPAVIELTRDLLGITDGERPLTVTGGLPYFGGAGNNYSMHAIATMMDHLRQKPGERGLITANGWYLTKHSLGIYSTDRPDRPFSTQDSASLRHQIETMPHPKMDPNPSGRASIETFTVMFDRSGRPQQGLVLGNLDRGGRFVAHTRPDETLLEQMTQQDPIGQTGRVQSGVPTNLFEFD